MRYYGDELGNSLPPDLEKTNVASAETASKTSKDSYTKTITLRLARGKQYEFYFKYENFCKLVGFGRNLRKSGLKSVGIARIAHKLNIISKILGWKKANT